MLRSFSESLMLIVPRAVQVVQVCAEHKKPRKLLKHLESVREAGRGVRNPPRVLIFANRVKTVRFVAATTAAAGFKTAILHGERSQAEREVRTSDASLNQTRPNISSPACWRKGRQFCLAPTCNLADCYICIASHSTVAVLAALPSYRLSVAGTLGRLLTTVPSQRRVQDSGADCCAGGDAQLPQRQGAGAGGD